MASRRSIIGGFAASFGALSVGKAQADIQIDTTLEKQRSIISRFYQALNRSDGPALNAVLDASIVAAGNDDYFATTEWVESEGTMTIGLGHTESLDRNKDKQELIRFLIGRQKTSKLAWNVLEAIQVVISNGQVMSAVELMGDGWYGPPLFGPPTYIHMFDVTADAVTAFTEVNLNKVGVLNG